MNAGTALLRRRLQVVVLGLVLATTSSAQTAPPTGELTVDYVTAERAQAGSALMLLDAVRAEGIPGGLQVSEGTWQQIWWRGLDSPSNRSSVAADSFSRSGDASTRVPLADLVAAFQLSHQGWQIEAQGDSVIIREDSLSPRIEVIPDWAVSNRPLNDAFYAAMRALEPSLPAEVGCAGSSLGQPGDAPAKDPCGSPSVSLSLRGATFEHLLTRLSAEVPGTAWVLIRHKSTSGGTFDTLSVRHADGSFMDFPQPIWGRPLAAKGK